MSLVDEHHAARERIASCSIPEIKTTEPEAHIESLPDTKLPLPSDTDSDSHTTDDDMLSSQHSIDTTTTTTTSTTMEEVPALPQKSSLRASRLLDLNIHKMVVEQPPFTQTAPHDVYLSSEEDASSSAGDFSDFDFESGSEDAEQSMKRRESHEDTARVISVVFAGKPSLVDLPRRSMSPSSNGSSSRPPSSLRRTSTDPVLGRRLSVCSSSGSSGILHPPRTSSMGPRKLEKQRPQFLSIDPYAAKAHMEDNETLKTPKTPTGMFKRTMSLVRKKSKPALHSAFLASRDNLSLITTTHHMEQVREMQEEPVIEEPQSAKEPPTYQEIIKAAKRRTHTPQPMSPMSPVTVPASPATPNSTRNRLRHFSARRRSIKA